LVIPTAFYRLYIDCMVVVVGQGIKLNNHAFRIAGRAASASD
jgi:hypothetical protein